MSFHNASVGTLGDSDLHNYPTECIANTLLNLTLQHNHFSQETTNSVFPPIWYLCKNKNNLQLYGWHLSSVHSLLWSLSKGYFFSLFLVKYELNYAFWFKELCRGPNCTSGRYLWAPLSEGGGIVTWSHYGIWGTGLEFWSPDSQPGVCSKNNLHEVASVLWCGIHLLAVSVKKGLVYFFHWNASSCWNIALVKKPGAGKWPLCARCQDLTVAGRLCEHK